ncbi:MAG: hypothetical protein HN396_04575 [Gemmatimonadales bacterium]|jgi:hypothetical protein|nr:hypothetical protein [Gemmatimonadales bacterium]
MDTLDARTRADSLMRVATIRADILRLAKGRFCGATFTKKDGTTRNMSFRLKGESDIHPEHGYMLVWDVNKRDYRQINIHTATVISVGGENLLDG